MYVLHVLICGDKWDIHVIYLMYVLVINLRVPPMNLCIGVGTRFHRDSPVELWGTL